MWTIPSQLGWYLIKVQIMLMTNTWLCTEKTHATSEPLLLKIKIIII